MSEPTPDTTPPVRVPRASYPPSDEVFVLELPLHLEAAAAEESPAVLSAAERAANAAADAGGEHRRDEDEEAEASAPLAAAPAPAGPPPVIVRIHLRRLRSKAKVKIAALQQHNEVEEKKRLAVLRKGRDRTVAPELYARPKLDAKGEQVVETQPGKLDAKRRPALIPVMEPPITTGEAAEDNFKLAVLLLELSLIKVENLGQGKVRSEDLDPAVPEQLEQLVDLLEVSGLLMPAIEEIKERLQPKGRQVF